MVMGDMEMTVDLAIIGSGPGGYGAAFRAADLGLDVAFAVIMAIGLQSLIRTARGALLWPFQ